MSIKHSFVLLDRDRIAQDAMAGRDAAAAASSWKIEIMHLDPNLEGLLLRLHPGQARRSIAPGDALKELRKIWPECRKPPTAAQLRQRFDLPALRLPLGTIRSCKGFWGFSACDAESGSRLK